VSENCCGGDEGGRVDCVDGGGLEAGIRLGIAGVDGDPERARLFARAGVFDGYNACHLSCRRQ
jgi:hypothetical protein